MKKQKMKKHEKIEKLIFFKNMIFWCHVLDFWFEVDWKMRIVEIKMIKNFKKWKVEK